MEGEEYTFIPYYPFLFHSLGFKKNNKKRGDIQRLNFFSSLVGIVSDEIYFMEDHILLLFFVGVV